MKNINTQSVTDLTLFGFGVVVFHDRVLAANVKKIGYEVFNIGGKEIGLSYPRWVYKLMHRK